MAMTMNGPALRVSRNGSIGSFGSATTGVGVWSGIVGAGSEVEASKTRGSFLADAAFGGPPFNWASARPLVKFLPEGGVPGLGAGPV